MYYEQVLEFLVNERGIILVNYDDDSATFKHSDELIMIVNFYNMELTVHVGSDEYSIPRYELEKIDITGGSV